MSASVVPANDQPDPIFPRLASFVPSLDRGRSSITEAVWYVVQWLLVSSWMPGSGYRRFILRSFGAKIGRGVVFRPGLRVTMPWKLEIGDDCWIGRDVWIDNLAPVRIANNVCISQGAYFCTGNHDWLDPSFRLITEPITLEPGSWVGAKAVLCPGVILNTCAIAAAGSVVQKSIPEYEIHAGNPARFVRRREAKAQAWVAS